MRSHLKVIAHHILNRVGGSPQVNRYYTDDKQSWIDIFSAIDRPEKDWVTYATIGLSQHSIQTYLPNHKELRVELIGVAYAGQELFANILASCAFNVIMKTHSCSPGIVYPNVCHNMIRRYP
ncbi:suppressor of fused domain protein [Streptococcus ovuberis]|uniref:Suppressor of fused domain protein n=1 Tax=Streptococcus ovuberis TaxID=1936207 RepID=A0A7X6S0L3_9STRE|nr:suppressor of fused domain protein [Streptococcus ovuberis]NKZ20298.1 suppressor of fused domain protein [Streptococcus ovuberis]